MRRLLVSCHPRQVIGSDRNTEAWSSANFEIAMFRVLLILIPTLTLTPVINAQADDHLVREAIERALPLVNRASAGSADNRQCFTCHNQALPVLAMTEARRRGFPIDIENYQRQLQHTFDHLDRSRDRYLEGKGTGGKADTAGYALWTLAAGEWPDDATTAAVTEYLLLWQADDVHWSCTSNRPPSEASDITTTYLAIRGLNHYGTSEQQERISARIDDAREWLTDVEPQDNEDRVFRLWGLKLAGAQQDVVIAAASDLAAKQQEDGGWRQLNDGTSDAYATATALVALHQAGAMATDDRVYQRGVAHLLKTQQEDGSWHVISRSDPFQTYFETGFPHGDDQFISTAASSWAVQALLATLPKVKESNNEQEK
jgi:N-acyl-D-amino-acid deacylase